MMCEDLKKLGIVRSDLSVSYQISNLFMVYFEYSTSVVDRVIEEMRQAEKYIRIAMFQIHIDDVFELLEEKLNDGVKIEVFTLPYESMKKAVRNDVEKNFKKFFIDIVIK